MSRAVLSIVVPVKDEEDAVGHFVERVRRVVEALDDPAANSFEILFVDDGSTDGTLEQIRRANAADPRVKAISFSRNFGKEAALSAGLDNARGDAVVPMDADLQDPPEVLGEMIAKWREGFDIVYGVRNDRETDSLPKRLTADLYYRAHNWLSSDKIPEHAGDFRLLDRKVVEVIRQMPERTRRFSQLRLVRLGRNAHIGMQRCTGRFQPFSVHIRGFPFNNCGRPATVNSTRSHCCAKS